MLHHSHLYISISVKVTKGGFTKVITYQIIVDDEIMKKLHIGDLELLSCCLCCQVVYINLFLVDITS